MQTEQTNKWTEKLFKLRMRWFEPDIDFDYSGELLSLMRPEVEEVLQARRGDAGPPSQSYRAQGAITGINFRLTDNELSFEEKVELLRQRRILEDFLAVHRTVWILDGKPL